MASATLVLHYGQLELELSPSIGGSISRFDHIGSAACTSILRKSHSPLQNVLDAANFPLVPFVNRIRDGVFRFRDRSIRLTPNMDGDPSPLHGQGWLSPWTIAHASDSSATLIFDHERGEWPWSYEARQEFALDPGGMTLVLACRNTSVEPMPCGLGQHPYFTCGPATRIQTQVEHVWTVDKDVLPVEKIAATGAYDIGDASVCGRNLDNGYDGWSGRSVFSDPNWPFTIELSSPNARFFQIYSPKAGGIFVAEPVSHANAALNSPEEEWPDLGMRVLEPGKEMSLAMRIDVRRTQSRE